MLSSATSGTQSGIPLIKARTQFARAVRGSDEDIPKMPETLALVEAPKRLILSRTIEADRQNSLLQRVRSNPAQDSCSHLLPSVGLRHNQVMYICGRRVTDPPNFWVRVVESDACYNSPRLPNNEKAAGLSITSQQRLRHRVLPLVDPLRSEPAPSLSDQNPHSRHILKAALLHAHVRLDHGATAYGTDAHEIDAYALSLETHGFREAEV